MGIQTCGTAVIAVTALLGFAGCGSQEVTAPSGAPTESAAKTAGSAEGSKIAKIVFVGQKDACECTRTRIDTTWSTLQSALTSFPQLTVERLRLDVDEKRCDELDDLGSLMVAPGIYFFDDAGKFVELLQGEVEEFKIVEALR